MGSEAPGAVTAVLVFTCVPPGVGPSREPGAALVGSAPSDRPHTCRPELTLDMTLGEALSPQVAAPREHVGQDEGALLHWPTRIIC